MSPQSAVHPFLHLKLTVAELAQVHADFSIFLPKEIRINRELSGECSMAGEVAKRSSGASSEKALHYVSPGDVITADTGFMR